MKRMLGPVLVASLATACVGGAQVFDPDRDAGLPEPCARPGSAPRLEGAIPLGPSSPAELGTICLGPALTIDGDGDVDCTVTIRLPAMAPAGCDAFAGLTLRGVETYASGASARVCDVRERTAETEPGWAYVLAADVEEGSLADAHCRPGVLPVAGVLDVSGVDVGPDATLDFSCAVRDGADGRSLGSPCTETLEPIGFVRGDSADWSTYLLSCDPVTHQLNLPCDRDTDCTDAGLEGDRCGTHGFCVPATCG